MPSFDDAKDDSPASKRETLERNTAINGAPSKEDDSNGSDSSNPRPAEGGDDTPPPFEGSPKG